MPSHAAWLGPSTGSAVSVAGVFRNAGISESQPDLPFHQAGMFVDDVDGGHQAFGAQAGVFLDEVSVVVEGPQPRADKHFPGINHTLATAVTPCIPRSSRKTTKGCIECPIWCKALS